MPSTTNYEANPLTTIDATQWYSVALVNDICGRIVVPLNGEILLFGIAWGYSAPPVAGASVRVYTMIEDVETTKVQLPVTQDGPGSLIFPKALRVISDSPDDHIGVLLSAGGAGITGYLNMLGFVGEL